MEPTTEFSQRSRGQGRGGALSGSGEPPSVPLPVSSPAALPPETGPKSPLDHLGTLLLIGATIGLFGAAVRAMRGGAIAASDAGHSGLRFVPFPSVPSPRRE